MSKRKPILLISTKFPNHIVFFSNHKLGNSNHWRDSLCQKAKTTQLSAWSESSDMANSRLGWLRVLRRVRARQQPSFFLVYTSLPIIWVAGTNGFSWKRVNLNGLNTGRANWVVGGLVKAYRYFHIKINKNK